jgi:hypothetical protein
MAIVLRAQRTGASGSLERFVGDSVVEDVGLVQVKL